MYNKLFLAALALTSCATELELSASDVPQPVLTAFHQRFPTATDVEWEAEKEKGRLVFEADFKIDNNRKEAAFKTDGTFIEKEN